MITGVTITHLQHKQALAIVCPVESCRAAVGCRCNVETVSGGHAARAHLFLSTVKPDPDEAALATFLRVDGIRDDAKPFLHWLSGEYEFRASPQQAGALTLRVFPLGSTEDLARLPVRGKGTDRSIAGVRRPLVELAARHGLIISATDKGRGRYIVTQRGVDFYQQHKEGSCPQS